MTELRVFSRTVRCLLIIFTGLITGCATTQPDLKANAEMSQRLHHVVIVWLKNSGDSSAIARYIEASQSLTRLPGVVSYEVGQPVKIPQRRASKALDESYDIAVASVFESQQAFAAFLKNPDYARVAQEQLRPLVEKYRVYDFIEP